MIDLPQSDNPPELTFFAEELIFFCRAKGYPAKIIDYLHRVDYSKTSHLAFVHSIGGSHLGEDWKRTGYPGLGTAVKKLGLQTEKGLEVDYVVRILAILPKAEANAGDRRRRWVR
jgi:hypothetical protein